MLADFSSLREVASSTAAPASRADPVTYDSARWHMTVRSQHIDLPLCNGTCQTIRSLSSCAEQPGRLFCHGDSIWLLSSLLLLFIISLIKAWQSGTNPLWRSNPAGGTGQRGRTFDWRLSRSSAAHWRRLRLGRLRRTSRRRRLLQKHIITNATWSHNSNFHINIDLYSALSHSAPLMCLVQWILLTTQRCLCTYWHTYRFAAGPRVWNYLPTDLRQPDLSHRRFREFLKTLLTGQWDQSAVWIAHLTAL